MNAHTAPAPVLSTTRSRWDTALRSYLDARRTSDEVPDDAPFADRAVDEACKAMDHLIEYAEAPDLAALRLKLDLARERAAAFQEVLFDDHARGIVADIYRLTERLGSDDLHVALLADRNRLFAVANQPGCPSGAAADTAVTWLNSLDERIITTPASSPDGLLAKAVLLVQTCAEGFDPNPDWVQLVLREARDIAGMGSQLVLEKAA